MPDHKITHRTNLHGCLITWSEDLRTANVYYNGEMVESFANRRTETAVALHTAIAFAKLYDPTAKEEDPQCPQT